MVGKVSQFTLQPMAITNHKFPHDGATGVLCEVKSTVSEKFVPILGHTVAGDRVYLTVRGSSDL